MWKKSCRAASPFAIRTRRGAAAAASPFTSDEPFRVKLFQIEEPDGGPTDTDASGAAIGIDASGSQAEVAFSVGGNALVLAIARATRGRSRCRRSRPQRQNGSCCWKG